MSKNENQTVFNEQDESESNHGNQTTILTLIVD